MDKQAQDKRWHRLSEREQAGWLENYKCNKEDGNKESMKIIEELFGTHNLKPKPLTYDDVVEKLVMKTDSNNVGIMMFVGEYKYNGLQREDVFSVKQAEKIIAINKLLNVAKFLNKDWKPDWKNMTDEDKVWSFGIDEGKIRAYYVDIYGAMAEIVFFRTMSLAEQAVSILGEDVIRTALGDY